MSPYWSDIGEIRGLSGQPLIYTARCAPKMYRVEMRIPQEMGRSFFWKSLETDRLFRLVMVWEHQSFHTLNQDMQRHHMDLLDAIRCSPRRDEVQVTMGLEFTPVLAEEAENFHPL